ncbi:MAG: hypothetical protein LBP87_03230 [Planctomycetaceae bacterium]|jgi:hypothetical protein|nr:hypothetical protein [Planctomycetaceae bacterium]
MMSKTLLFIVCVFLIIVVPCFLSFPVYAGELYETEEYLSAINVDNPYGDNPPPVVDTSPQSPLGSPPSNGNPSGPRNNDPVPDADPGNSSGGNGSYGGGNFNQFFGFDQSSQQGSWQRSQQGSQQSDTKSQEATRDYLTQAILTNTGGFLLQRSRGKRYGQQKTQTGYFGDVFTVSVVSQRVREIRDKQVAYKKIQGAVKTPYERCYKTTFVADGCWCDGCEVSVSSLTEIKQTMFACLSA